MTTASKDDLVLYSLYRSQVELGESPSRARAFAMGREVRSTQAFDEAIERVESELLALPGADDVRRSSIVLGFSESAARAEAIDHAWSLIEARRVSAPSPATSSLAPHEQDRVKNLTEAWRRRWAEGDEQVRESMRTEWGFDGQVFVDEQYALELAESKLGGSPVQRPRPAKPKPTSEAKPPVSVELREVGGDVDAQLEEAFRSMGLSDEAARDAARGR